MKDADPYKVIEEFCCRMTGTLKEWYHNLGAVRQNQFHELRSAVAVLELSIKNVLEKERSLKERSNKNCLK